MRIFFNVYKNSVIATLIDIIGSLFIAFAIYAFVPEAIKGNFSNTFIFILWLLGGFLAKYLGFVLSERKSASGEFDIETVESFVSSVRKSSVTAFSVYKENPNEEIIEYLKVYNPFAAKLIGDINSGYITENDALKKMREYDEIPFGN